MGGNDYSVPLVTHFHSDGEWVTWISALTARNTEEKKKLLFYQQKLFFSIILDVKLRVKMLIFLELNSMVPFVNLCLLPNVCRINLYLNLNHRNQVSSNWVSYILPLWTRSASSKIRFFILFLKIKFILKRLAIMRVVWQP